MSAATATALATGPRTDQGKAIASRNSLTHGLTSKSTLLPSEDPQEFADFQAALNQRYGPESLEDIGHIAEFADLTWRLQRIPIHEAKLIAVELKRMQIERKSDKALAELLEGLDDQTLEAIAFERLLKTLTNLHRQEARLSRRLTLLQPHLDRLLKIQAHRRNVAAQQRRIAASFATDPDTGAGAANDPPVRMPRNIFRS